MQEGMMKLLLPISAALLLSGCSMDFFSWEETKVEKVEERIIVTAPAEIDVAWRADLDQRRPASPSGFSTPAVVQGSEGQLIVAGAQDKRVRIFRSNGSELHRIAMSAAGESGGLQLANGLVVVGDVNGMLNAIDVNAGQLAWSVQLSSSLMSRPVPAGNDFIVQTDNNQVFRFTQDGAKVWSYSGPASGLSIQYTPSPVLHRDRVYVSMKSGDVVALKADNGSFLWQRQLLVSNEAAVLSELKAPAAAPVIIPAEFSGRSEDMLVVPVFQDQLYFLSLLDGSTLMSRGISTKSSVLHVGNRIFVAGADGALSALDAAGGETLWKQRLSSSELTGPVLWQQHLWVADEYGMVFRLNLDGKLVASTELSGRFDIAPVAAADGVLVRNDLGTLFKLH